MRGKNEQLSDIKIHKNALEVMILASFLPPKHPNRKVANPTSKGTCPALIACSRQLDVNKYRLFLEARINSYDLS